MKVKIFYKSSTPNSAQELEDDVNAFLSSLPTPPNPIQGAVTPQPTIQLLNDHQSNLYALVTYPG